MCCVLFMRGVFMSPTTLPPPMQVSPLSVVPQSFIPALFGHATSDTFIKIHHTEKLYEAYAGDKNFIK